MKKYTVLYFGTWGYGRAGLKSLLRQPQVEIKKVFSKWDTENADPYLNQVYHLAKAHHLPIVHSGRGRLTKRAFQEAVRDTGKVDFILSCCFDRIFPSTLLSFPTLAALNVHPSLLPKYRGVKPLENALANGESSIGVTLHELVQELDAGDILLQKGVSIGTDQTFKELYNIQCRLIESLLDEFFSNPAAWLSAKKPQNHLLQSQAPRLPFSIADDDTVSEIIRKKSSSMN